MMKQIEKICEKTELMIELIIGTLECDGYECVRYSETDRHFTSTYDCIVVKDRSGNKIFALNVENRGNSRLSYLFEEDKSHNQTKGISSFGTGDTLECLNCKNPILLDSNTFKFNCEGEYVCCPKCKAIYDVQAYHFHGKLLSKGETANENLS